MISEYKNLTTVCTFTSSTVIPLRNFVKKSTVRMIYHFPFLVTGRSSIISIPICAKGSITMVDELASEICQGYT